MLVGYKNGPNVKKMIEENYQSGKNDKNMDGMICIHGLKLVLRNKGLSDRVTRPARVTFCLANTLRQGSPPTWG